MRIDRSDPADEPDDAHVTRRAQSGPDVPDATGKDKGKAVDGSGSPGLPYARPDPALQAEQKAVNRARVAAVCRQYDIEQGRARVEKPDDGVSLGTRRTDDPEPHPVAPDERRKGETLRALGGDVPDDPRNHSNPKTGRIDASWLAYDRAIAAAREHSGGVLGSDSIKMYDRNPKTGEGTGTLIGEQTPDRLRGWRIDSQDGHVNWWDWTGGKKGAGGIYGHDWFPEDPSTPGSRYIGWAPWQDNNGNILEGN